MNKETVVSEWDEDAEDYEDVVDEEDFDSIVEDILSQN